MEKIILNKPFATEEKCADWIAKHIGHTYKGKIVLCINSHHENGKVILTDLMVA